MTRWCVDDRVGFVWLPHLAAPPRRRHRGTCLDGYGAGDAVAGVVPFARKR